MVILDAPGSLVISYLGGCFGNSLAAAIMMSETGKLFMPKSGNFHDFTDWVIDPPSEMVTMTSDIKLRRWPSTMVDIVQVHCLNSSLLQYKFPSSRRILLTCSSYLEKYAIHRQWNLLNDLDQDRKALALNAWDWITYHLNHYNNTGRESNDNECLCIDFQKIQDSWSMIEDLLDFEISAPVKKIYRDHIESQMERFYSLDPCFDLAWSIYDQHGADAPIEDMINEVLQ